MAQRTDIVRISFQANARGANAAIDSLRVKCEECNAKVTQLKKDLKEAPKMNKTADEIDKIRTELNAATKETRQWTKAYNELAKGMRTLDQGVKAFNDGTLNQMNQAFQKALYNAAKLARTKLDPMSDTYKQDKKELTAIMDASQQYYARLQADSAQVIKTIKEGGKVSRQAVADELAAHRELLQVLAEDDAGYKRTVRNIAILENYQRALGGNYADIRKNIKDTGKVSDEMLRNMYRELQQTNAEGKVTKDIIIENAKAMKEIRDEQVRRVKSVIGGGDMSQQSEGSIRAAIASAKELIQVYGSTSKKAQELAGWIVNAEEHLKTTGVEAARAARKQADAAQLLADKHKMMSDRMANLKGLSKEALNETQKFWQEQMDGAVKGSRAYKEAARNLKAVAAEQERLNSEQLEASAKRLGRKNLRTLSGTELQESINAAKQLLAAMRPTNSEYKKLQENILKAEEFQREYSLETARGNRQAAAQLQTMTDRMTDLKSLSAGALEETKRFWQAQMDGAEKGSRAYAEAEAHVKAIVTEQERLAAIQTKTDAQKIFGNKMLMSEGSIRNAIEAARRYQQTLSATSPEYKRLSIAIVDAEEHVRKYGVEAERTARKEAAAIAEAARKRQETDTAMRKQLYNQKDLSESALKAQEQYWRRLIDDPNTASQSIARYEKDLRRVQQLQQQMVADRGQDALAFFRGDISDASASQVAEQKKALVAYRDSLPKKTDAAIIAEINSYIEKTATAAKVAAGEMMELSEAEALAGKLGTRGFSASTDKLKLAKKALEEAQSAAGRGTRRFTELQEAINKVDLELAKTGELSAEIQKILDQPKGRSINELKQAIEQGRAALANMRTDTKEGQKAFEELSKKVKEADIQMKSLAGTAKGTASAFDKAWSRLKTYIGLYMGAAVAIQKLTGTMGDLMELSDKMGEVRKTTGFTADEVGRLSENLKKMDVRTPLVQLMEVSASAGQLGLKTLEDVQGFTEAANKLMIALPEMGKEAATEMMRVAIATGEVDKIRRQMDEGVIDGSSATAVAMEKIASTIDRLRATSASTAPEITDFVKRVGAVGAQSGITIDQVSALGSTVSSLGMRVEMSATALSRMIPAIKNNSFAIGKAIGVTQSWIDEQFKAGKGMDVILRVFDHIRQANMDAESIEQMFGSSMKDVMAELNQQGARAGIVFAGLSQGVDELRRQLGVASEAYEENTAIQNEFNKMNETTAAKWERLKNQLEETFVSDSAQRFFGGIIDGLRKIADFISDDGPISKGMKAILVLWAAFKIGIGQAILVSLPKAFGSMTAAAGSFFTTAIVGLKALTWELGVHNMALGRARVEWKKMDLALKQNIFGVVIAAVGILVYKLVEWRNAVAESRKEIGKWAQEIVSSESAVKKNFGAVDKASDSILKANKALKKAQFYLKMARQEADGSKESADRLAKAEDNVKKAEDGVTTACDGKRAAIANINNIYGKYLGFMLSEISNASELANAQELVNARLRENITLKRRQAALDRLEGEYGEERDKKYGALSQALQGAVRKKAKVGGKEQWTTDEEATARLLREVTKIAQDTKLSRKEAGEKIDQLLSDAGRGGGTNKDWRAGIRNRALEYQKEYKNFQSKVKATETQFDAEAAVDREESRERLAKQYDLSERHYRKLESGYAKAVGEARQKAAADMLKEADQMEEMLAAAPNYYKMTNKEEELAYNRFVADTEDRLKGIREQRDALMKEAGSLYGKNEGGSGAGGGASPYGGYKPLDPYEMWDADSLVARKKQMLDYVKALANGADVQAVLAKDEKFMDDAAKKSIKNVRDAIEWYNTERLKIQDELAGRHLTNEGGWANPAKEKGSKKPKQPMSESAVAQLEEYYAWRKEETERQRTEEGISEAEYNRRMEALELEHLQKRADLRNSFTKMDKQQVEQFRKWWESVRELDRVEWELVDAEWKVAIKRDRDYNEMKAAKDLSAMQGIVVRQMKAIEDIIAKERPFNGITENLEKNLTTIGVLFADLDRMKARALADGGDTNAIDALYGTDRSKRLSFILGEAEHAYSTTVEEVMRRMGEAGMTAWADEIRQSPKMQEALMAQLHQTYDAIQDAIRREASQIKKQAEIMWNNILLPGGDGNTTVKDAFEKAISQLGIEQGRVSRANSMTGAGQASERVADRLAIKQLQLQLAMQQHYYNLMKKQGKQRIEDLNRQADQEEKLGNLEEARRKRQDAEHAAMSLKLAMTREQTDLMKQQEDIIARTEESQARLYQELREWGDLVASSVKELFEASNAGNREYFNELAKLNLTGKGGPGAGTYIVIENEGTEDAKAHYEYLDERAALERQREIEQQNAQADAWKKVMDDLNQKMSDQITDWMNAMFQNAYIDANTDATLKNTAALLGLSSAIVGFKSESALDSPDLGSSAEGTGDKSGTGATTSITPEQAQEFVQGMGDNPMMYWSEQSDIATKKMLDNMAALKKGQDDTNKKMQASAQSTFAKMIAAANMYGIAYQAMSNDNLSTTQKFEMMAVQAAGQSAISMLTVDFSKMTGDAAINSASVLGKLWSQLGYWAVPVYALFTGLLGGLMGMAVSKIAKSKSEIAQASGASVGAGRLSTGMQTYAEGNVNEFTDPNSLTPGRRYNVDAADGQTYRARYMGKNPKTHLTNGAEFHLVGERGREAIIDAHTTRLMQMDDTGIWKSIQTLYNGGSVSAVRRSRRGRGVRAFADGNLDEFTDDAVQLADDSGAATIGAEQLAAFQSSLDRNNELLDRALTNGIKGVFGIYGPDGLVATYDKGKKTAARHGEKY